MAFQAPTANNNYTWYRLYSDGWVEQGGYGYYAGTYNYTVPLPVEMSDNHYTAIATTFMSDGTYWATVQNQNQTTTGFHIRTVNYVGTMTNQPAYWMVSGYAKSVPTTRIRCIKY